MAAQIEQDGTSPSSSDMWKVLMRIEDNTNSLINDFKALQRNYNELRVSLEFSQAKIDDLSTSNSALQTKMESMKKKYFVLETKLQESLMKNALLEDKIHELNTKHDDLEQYTRKYNENLTAQRAALFKKVRDKKRLRQGWKVWTTDGKIFVKPDLTVSLDHVIRINSVEDLEKL